MLEAFSGKLRNAIKELKKKKINFMGISELRWPELSTCTHESGTLCFSGSVENDRRHSNGILVNSQFIKYKGYII